MICVVLNTFVSRGIASCVRAQDVRCPSSPRSSPSLTNAVVAVAIAIAIAITRTPRADGVQRHAPRRMRYMDDILSHTSTRARTSHRDVQHAKASLNLGTQSPRRRKTVRTVSVHATTRRRETGLRTSSNITYHCSYYILKRRDAEVSARRVMTCACIAQCNVWCARPRRATRCDAMRCVHATRAMTPRESRCAAGYKI